MILANNMPDIIVLLYVHAVTITTIIGLLTTSLITVSVIGLKYIKNKKVLKEAKQNIENTSEIILKIVCYIYSPFVLYFAYLKWFA